MHWTDEFIGIPWQRGGRSLDGMDCFGLFVHLHRVRFGRELYDPRGYMSNAWRLRLADKMKAEHWRPVDRASEGDAVLFHVNGRPLHVGFALDHRRMLHVQNSANSVIERFDATKWGGRLEGLYSYVE